MFILSIKRVRQRPIGQTGDERAKDLTPEKRAGLASQPQLGQSLRPRPIVRRRRVSRDTGRRTDHASLTPSEGTGEPTVGR